MAERLVAQLAPEPGEKILLVARPGNFDDLIPHLRYALMKAGAVDLGVIDVIEEPYPERWDREPSASGDRRNQDGAPCAPVTPLCGTADRDDAARIPGSCVVLECR